MDDGDALRELRAILAAAGSGDDDAAAAALSALALLGSVRAHLDDLERRLIESARDREATWSQIAAGLGLATRQAAEQRLLRLRGDATRNPSQARVGLARQRTVDKSYGAEIGRLRAAVRAVHRLLESEPARYEAHPRAALARKTLELAGDAEPGALFGLAVQAIADLDAVPPDHLPQRGVQRLRRALAQADPNEELSLVD